MLDEIIQPYNDIRLGNGDVQPRPQGFSLKKMGGPTHFLREKPWGRGWVMICSIACYAI